MVSIVKLGSSGQHLQSWIVSDVKAVAKIGILSVSAVYSRNTYHRGMPALRVGRDFLPVLGVALALNPNNKQISTNSFDFKI